MLRNCQPRPPARRPCAHTVPLRRSLISRPDRCSRPCVSAGQALALRAVHDKRAPPRPLLSAAAPVAAGRLHQRQRHPQPRHPRGRDRADVPAAGRPQRRRGQRVRLHQLRARRPAGEARAALGRRQAHDADPRSAVRELRHHVVRPVVRREDHRAVGAAAGATSLPAVRDERRRQRTPRQITEGPYDYVYPVFLPGQRILFMASKSVEAGSPQFQDEYERQTTAQVGTINMDGSMRDAGAPQRLAPGVARAHARRQRAVHRMAPPGRRQRRPPARHEHRHDRHARGLRRRGPGRDQQLPQGPLRRQPQGRLGPGHLPGGHGRHLARSHPAGGQAAAGRPGRGRAFGRRSPT